MNGPAVTGAPGAHPGKDRLRAWLRMLRAGREVETVLRERLRLRHDTTLPRFDVLAALERVPEGLRMSDLSARLKVSNGNVTGIVDRLVAEGLVLRAAVDGDRRAMAVRLTAEGRARFARMAADHEAWIGELFAGFSAAELRQFQSLLARIGAEKTR